MNLNEITPLILTYNEEPNIGRVLQHLNWAKKIVIVDSGSEDQTLIILKEYPQIQLYQRKFDTHADQWNYGLSKVLTDWVLVMDADYIITNSLINEISDLNTNKVDGYCAEFTYYVFGKPLRSALLPVREILFKRDGAYYFQDGHTQRLGHPSIFNRLRSPVLHDDRKSLSRWCLAQLEYSRKEAIKINQTSFGALRPQDQVRKMMVIAPLLVFLYCMFIKGLFLDGYRGLYYAFQRTTYELLLSICLLELVLVHHNQEVIFNKKK